MPIPNHYVRSVTDITKDWLNGQGIDTLLIDLDNTLLPRDTNEVPPHLLDWSENLKRDGFKICLVSNNWHERVTTVADQLGYELVCKAVKPLPPAFLMALRKLGSSPRSTAVIGDQFFTDVLGGTFLGMKTIMVLPLAQKDLWHTLMLRRVEKLILGSREPVDSL